MSDFSGMEDLLQDFLVEATDLLSGVDNKLVELEKNPHDRGLLNDIFRGFHTIKGGAGFLNATELVTLCHLTENLFDKLRTGELDITAEAMDVIMAATATVRDMFDALEKGTQPRAADGGLIASLKQAIAGELKGAEPKVSPPETAAAAAPAPRATAGVVDWNAYYAAVTGKAPEVPAQAGRGIPQPPKPDEEIIKAAIGRRASDKPGYGGPTGRRESEKVRDNSIRVDTARLDQVLNLSGEIGLTKNRLTSLRTEILAGLTGTETLQALDAAVGQLDLLVSDLQNAVMKTRMQPIGRLFQKYPRIARDLARNLGKDVELVLAGEETEIDKTMIEDLSDPIIHLIRNAVDHGVESPLERRRPASRKSPKCAWRPPGGRSHRHPDRRRRPRHERRALRAKALEKGLIGNEEANTMDERQSFNLVFLPGFSTAAKVSDVSGRGVGMDVVRTNIQKLNGSIEIKSELGKGTTFIISLPLTLAILPVLVVKLGEQPFAVPLSMVREILPIVPGEIQEVGGRATMVVRGEVLPVYPLRYMMGWPEGEAPAYGVLMQSAELSFILAIDNFAGRDDAVIKSIEGFRPKGVAGVTTLANGQIVLILDVKELLADLGDSRGVALLARMELARLRRLRRTPRLIPHSHTLTHHGVT
jgi:two-component system chemotaxis sensor kinase CheA